MSTNRTPRRETDTPQLRVYYEEEEDNGVDRHTSDALRQARRKWARCEAYWAERNRAARLSGRLVA